VLGNLRFYGAHNVLYSEVLVLWVVMTAACWTLWSWQSDIFWWSNFV